MSDSLQEFTTSEMNPGILYSGRVRAGMRKIQNSGFQTLVPLKWDMFGPFQGLSLLLVEVLIREVHCTVTLAIGNAHFMK